ncbi:MAG: hypothetical protein JSW73_02865 [Candidatus Woesearchaeota archaeon]|nr:MAG: hypothetical protein JSW73_02865 [Candidatus Woesearchaeota archaeon]
MSRMGFRYDYGLEDRDLKLVKHMELEVKKLNSLIQDFADYSKDLFIDLAREAGTIIKIEKKMIRGVSPRIELIQESKKVKIDGSIKEALSHMRIGAHEINRITTRLLEEEELNLRISKKIERDLS